VSPSCRTQELSRTRGQAQAPFRVRLSTRAQLRSPVGSFVLSKAGKLEWALRPAACKHSCARAGKPKLRSGSGSAPVSGRLVRSLEGGQTRVGNLSLRPAACIHSCARAGGEAARCPVSSAQCCAPCRMSCRRNRAGQDASAKSGSG
jgi:hypothetical protein